MGYSCAWDGFESTKNHNHIRSAASYTCKCHVKRQGLCNLGVPFNEASLYFQSELDLWLLTTLWHLGSVAFSLILCQLCDYRHSSPKPTKSCCQICCRDIINMLGLSFLLRFSSRVCPVSLRYNYALWLQSVDRLSADLCGMLSCISHARKPSLETWCLQDCKGCCKSKQESGDLLTNIENEAQKDKVLLIRFQSLRFADWDNIELRWHPVAKSLNLEVAPR